jgi:hypothetical protein
MQLSASEFDQYCKRNRLSQATAEYISAVRNGPPSRRVGDHARGNVCGRVPTVAIDQTVQAESRQCEALFVYICELSPDVLEIWDQPVPIQLRRSMKKGGVHVSTYTADFLILRTDGPVLFECKTAEELRKKVAEKPDEWSFTSDAPRYVPASFAAEAIGLKHEVYVSDDTAPVHLANMEYLHALYLAEPAPIRDSVKNAVTRRLADEPLTILELCASVRWLEPRMVYTLLVQGILCGALRAQVLSQQDTFRLFLNPEAAAQFERELIQVYRSGPEDDTTTDLSVLTQATPTELAHATKIYAALQPVLAGERKPTRTDYRYLARLRSMSATNAHPLAACLPHFARRGNRISRLTDAQEGLAKAVINRLWKSGVCKHVPQLLGHLDNECDAHDIPRISKESLRIRCDRVAPEAVAEGRLGIRGYNAAHPPVSAEHATLRCEIPGLIAHLDSTQFDCRAWDNLALSSFCAPPWIYCVYDEASNRALGAWLGFGKADRFALSLVYRDLVARQGRVPPYFIVDRGAEYGSTFWETLLASANSTKYQRPSGAPKFGGLIESSLKQINDNLANRLAGATWADQRARSASGGKKSRATARLELAAIIAAVRWFLFEVWNKTRHGAADATPDELWDMALPQWGALGSAMKPGLAFLIATSVPVGIRLGRRKGIRCGFREYWADELNGFRRPYKFEASRLDAATPSILYIKSKGRWVTTFARDHNLILPLTEEGRFLENYRLRTNAGLARQDQRGSQQRVANRVEMLERSHAAEAASVAAEPQSAPPPIPASPIPVPAPSSEVDLDTFEDIPYID